MFRLDAFNRKRGRRAQYESLGEKPINFQIEI